MKLRTAAIAGALAVVAAMVPGAAQATAPTFSYGGYAGGTQITAVGLTVSSDLTAESQVTGTGNQSKTNSVAKVNVAGLVAIGGVTTDSTGAPFGDGSAVRTHARTAGVSLLNGLIQVGAIDTVATASASSTSAPTANTTSTFVGLKIAGKSYPVNPAQNTFVTIPGIATVGINFSAAAANSDAAATIGDGLVVTLLQARAGAAAGARILVNPVYASVTKANTNVVGLPIGGFAYGSYVHANVGNQITVESGQTAPNSLPSYGTNGTTITNHTAKAYLAGVLNLGAIETAGNGVQSAALSDAMESAKITGLNLFGGLITATAIGTTAHVRVVGGASGTATSDGALEFVNLRIAGKTIPINVSPNTKISVAGLGVVTVNQQDTLNNAAGIAERVIGLHIVLTVARGGLPIGANVEVATSGVVIYK